MIQRGWRSGRKLKARCRDPVKTSLGHGMRYLVAEKALLFRLSRVCFNEGLERYNLRLDRSELSFTCRHVLSPVHCAL